MTTDVTLTIDLDDIVSNLSMSDVAEEIRLKDLAAEISLSDLAAEIDMEDLASHINTTRLAENTMECNYDRLAEKVSVSAMASHLGNEWFVRLLAAEMFRHLTLKPELRRIIVDAFADHIKSK
jgi:hypothetical protein